MKRNKPMKWLYAFLAFMLVFSAVPFGGVSAKTLNATIDSNEQNILLTKINTDGGKFDIKLTEGNWASDFSNNSYALKALINSMEADSEQEKWDSYKNDITATVDKNTLTVNLPSGKNYEITANQTITINLNGSLLENWNDTVNSVKFKIITEPKLLLDGTIKNATVTDIKQGGKTIELKLVNAKWEVEKLKETHNLKALLSNFKVGTNTWEVISELLSNDFTKNVSFSSDSSTIIITLPPSNKIDSSTTVQFTGDVAPYYVVDFGQPFATSALSIFIDEDTDITILNSFEEEHINNNTNDSFITLTLKKGSWVTMDKYKTEVLIDALQPKNQVDEWNRVKSSLKENKDTIATVSGDNKTLTLKMKTAIPFNLSEDLQLALKVPSQLLTSSLELPEKTITIKAQPKVLVSGSATSSVSYEDLIKGGKTIELTLVNTTWNDVSVIRNELLSLFNWEDLDLEDTSILDQIKSKAIIVKNSENKITITLPQLNPFKINIVDSEYPSLKMTTQPGNSITKDVILGKTYTIFRINSLKKATAKITAPKGKSEFDVVKEGFSFIISLTNDQWINDIETEIKDANINNWFGTDQLKLAAVNTENGVKAVTRLSDTELKINIGSNGYLLTKDAEYKNLVIPKNFLSLSSEDVTVTGTIEILDVSAELSGTAGSNIDAVNLEKGGKTIIISLKNANFKNDVTIDETKIISSTNTDLEEAFESAISSQDITVKGNKLTIKLPKISTTESGELSFSIPATYIAHDGAGTNPLVVKDTLSVGAKAAARISPSSLSEADIKNNKSNQTTTLVITLTDAKWDPNIVNNKSKQNSLLKGFTVDGQEDAWDKVIKAFKDGGSFQISATDSSILNIRLPKNIDYSIIRDQDLSLKIPKSVLENYKYDIDVDDTITIKSPSFTTGGNNKTFLTFLPELSKLSTSDIEKTRVYVPEKLLEQITVTNVAVPNSGNITTVVVKTNDENAEVTPTIITTVKNNDGTTTPKEDSLPSKKGKETTFIFTNVDPKSELKVTVKAGNKQTVETVKVGKGKKTYSYLPKKSLDGFYSLSSILSDEKQLKEIFKYYKPEDLEVGTVN